MKNNIKKLLAILIGISLSVGTAYAADVSLTKTGVLQYLKFVTDSLVIGRTSTTTNSLFEVNGTTTATNFVATSTTVDSVFPRLSVTNSTTTAATSTSLFSTLLRATTGYFTSLFLPSLATPAGSLIAVDANGQFIATTTPTGVSATPAGADTQVQFNDGGAFNGESGFTYQKSPTELVTMANGTVSGELRSNSLHETSAGIVGLNLDTTNIIAQIGSGGFFKLKDGTSAFELSIDTAALTGNHALGAPDKDGTIAVLSDITNASSTLHTDNNTFTGSNIFSFLTATRATTTYATTTFLNVSGNATTSFGNGINLTSGCLTYNGGSCITSGGSGASSTLLTDANTFTGSTSINTLTTIRSTSTQATSTNFFSSILTATSGFLTNLFVTGSSTLQDVTMRNATTTAATTTNLNISGGLSFGGVTGTAWSSFCTSITGSADLCDGSDATGGGGGSANATSTYDWVIYPTGSSVGVWRAKTSASAGTFSDFDDAANFIVNAATSSVPAETSIKIDTGTYQVNASTTIDGNGIGFSAAKFFWYGNGTSTMLVVNNNTSAFNLTDRARVYFENIGFNLNGGADAFYASTTQTSPVASIAESEFFGIKSYSSGVNHTGWVFHFKDAFRYHIMDFHAKDVGNCFSDENNYSNAAFINGDGQIDGFNFCELNNPTAGVNNGGRVVSLRGNSGLVNQMVFKNINGITNSNNSTMFYINHASRIVIEDNNSEQFATTTDVINSNNVHMKTSKYITPWTGLANATIISTDANSYNNTFSLSEAELSASTYIFRDANTIAPTRPNTIQGYNGNQFTLSDNGGSVLWATTTSTVVRDVFDNLTGNESYLGRVKITGGNIAMDFLNSRTTLFQYANSAYRWLVGGTEVMSLTSTGLLTTVNYQATASSSFQNFTGLKATTTAATTTNLFSSIASSTNLFSTNFFSGGLNTCNAANQALTYTNGLFGCNSAITGASSTLLANNNTFSGANSFATLLVTGSSTLQNFTGLKSTTTAATTTDLTVTDAPIFSALTGMLKGNGSSPLTVAVNGTDFSLITAKTCTAGDFVNAVTAAGVFTCATPSGGGGGGGSGIGWTWNSINSLYMSTSTDDLLLGASATSSTAKFEVKANAGLLAGVFLNGAVAINATGTLHRLDVNGRIHANQERVYCRIPFFSQSALTADGMGSATVAPPACTGKMWTDVNTDGTIQAVPDVPVNFASGTPYLQGVIAGNTTSGVANEYIELKTMSLGSATSSLGNGIAAEWTLNLPNISTATTSVDWWWGFSDVGLGAKTTTATYATPVNSCMLVASSTANFLLVARKASVETRTTTSISTSTVAGSNSAKFLIVMDQTGCAVYLNDSQTAAGTIAASAIPVVSNMKFNFGVGIRVGGFTTAALARMNIGDITWWGQ